MHNSVNVVLDESRTLDGSRQECRVLVVGRTQAGCLVAALLDERGFEVTVTPSDTDSKEWDPPAQTTSRAMPPAAIDSNQFGVRVRYTDGETAYYDLAVGATGDRRFLDGQDRRRVVVVPAVGRQSVTDTAAGLGALATLADALGGAESVTSALQRYRQWRDTVGRV
jgi:hypothetical protein